MRNFKIVKDGRRLIKTYLDEHGIIHRDGDLPAKVVKHGSIMGVSYWKNGAMHRDNVPAAIMRSKGRVLIKSYYNNGDLIRTEYVTSNKEGDAQNNELT